MSRKSDDVFRLREQMEQPAEPLPRGGLGGLKRAQLERMLEEQNDAITDMKRVFYRDTEELRDQLIVLNTENRALKERLSQMDCAEGKPADIDESVIRERLRPIVERLQKKHTQEMESLRTELRSFAGQLEQANKNMEAMREKSGAQYARRQEIEQALEQAQREIEALKEQRTQDEQALLSWQSAAQNAAFAGAEDAEDMPLKRRQEYRQALSAAMRRSAQQEELIQALTRQLENTAAHYRDQRAQQMDCLRDIREGFDILYELLSPDEQAAAARQAAPRSAQKPRLIPISSEQ